MLHQVKISELVNLSRRTRIQKYVNPLSCAQVRILKHRGRKSREMSFLKVIILPIGSQRKFLEHQHSTGRQVNCQEYQQGNQLKL